MLIKDNYTKEHFNEIAGNYDLYKEKNRYYYENLKKIVKSCIPEGKKVLEIGCGTGDLLYVLKPRVGYGIDISQEMIKIAGKKYGNEKNLKFSKRGVTSFKKEKLDYIFMVDVIEHLESPLEMFKQVNEIMRKNTIFVCTMANPVWEPILLIAEKLKMKMPEGKHHRYSYNQVKNFLKLAGLALKRHGYSLLIPFYIPIITNLVNKNLEKTFQGYAFIEYFIATKN